MKSGFLYIIKCSDGSYYTGSTNDIEYRMMQHAAGEAANHTRERLPVELIYTEEYDNIAEAFAREKQIQNWSRSKKEALINGDYKTLEKLSKNYTQFPPEE